MGDIRAEVGSCAAQVCNDTECLWAREQDVCALEWVLLAWSTSRSTNWNPLMTRTRCHEHSPLQLRLLILFSDYPDVMANRLQSANLLYIPLDLIPVAVDAFVGL
jgi:hypothetical protein